MICGGGELVRIMVVAVMVDVVDVVVTNMMVAIESDESIYDGEVGQC